MRVWLSRDPRVIAMADHLAGNRDFMKWLTDPVQQSCRESAYEHVTRNVTVALCVTSLLVTWGTAREQGDRDGDDLVLSHADLNTLDAMTDVPGFGLAMSFVDWAVAEKKGGVRFPKFFKENESPDEKHKRQAAERQARFREKQSRSGNAEVTQLSNVTVTHREEKRREEKNNTPSPPSGAFLRFWTSWPAHERKEAKGKCWERWRKSDLDEVSETILAHVESLKQSERWRNGYIVAPLVYLNQRRWEGAEETRHAEMEHL